LIPIPITFGAIGNGTVTATADGTGISNGDAVEKGRNIIFTAVPDNGHRVKEWKLNGTAEPGNRSNSFSMQNFLTVFDVTVEFEPIPLSAHRVTFSAVGGNGTLTAKADNYAVSSPAYVDGGMNVVFTATPHKDHYVKEWRLNGVTVSYDQDFALSNLSSDADVTVIFGHVSQLAPPKGGLPLWLIAIRLILPFSVAGFMIYRRRRRKK
ncbi:MAG: hypothetical protein LBI08_04060, partial [Methanomassiliicoccaceae archaeon]|nr:hypothetical protein [Methanomassiliicoccaceae archaeon]